MSNNWPVVKLGDVLTHVERTEQVDPTREYRLLGVRLDGGGAFLRETIVGAQTAATKLSRVAEGDFIYSRLFACRGAFGVVTPELSGCYVSSEFPTFVPRDGRVDINFLQYWFRLGNVIDRVNQDCTGSTPLTRNRFKENFFLALEIPLPPLAEQRRVVARIEELAAQIGEARALRAQAAEEAEALTKSTLSQELTAAAKKYGVQPMAEVATCAAGFGFPKQHQGRTGLKYPFVKVSDMNLPKNQRAITSAQNWVDDDDVRELKLKIYPVGTVIFPKIGGAIATNKRRVLSLPATFDNNVMGLIPSDKLLSEYLFAFMQSFDLTELQAGTSVPAISQGRVKALKIPVPPLAEQRKIVAELDALQAKVDALKRLQAETAAELDALLPSILIKAFKGEL